MTFVKIAPVFFLHICIWIMICIDRSEKCYFTEYGWSFGIFHKSLENTYVLEAVKLYSFYFELISPVFTNNSKIILMSISAMSICSNMCVSKDNICFLQSLTCMIWFFFHLMEVLNLRSHGRTSIGLSHGRVQARKSFPVCQNRSIISPMAIFYSIK